MSDGSRSRWRRRLILWTPIVCVFWFSAWAVRGFMNDLYWRDDMVVAARTGDRDTMKWLMALGADPSMVGREEHLTPLGAAASMGQTEAVRLLLDHGADPNRRDDGRNTALTLAVQSGHPAIATMLRLARGHE